MIQMHSRKKKNYIYDHTLNFIATCVQKLEIQFTGIEFSDNFPRFCLRLCIYLNFRTVLLEYYQSHLFLGDPGTYRTTPKTTDLLFFQYSDGGAPIW